MTKSRRERVSMSINLIKSGSELILQGCKKNFLTRICVFLNHSCAGPEAFKIVLVKLGLNLGGVLFSLKMVIFGSNMRV